MIQLATQLRKYREKYRLTQQEVAAFCYVTKATVSKWENGLSTPDVELLPLLASRFGTTVDTLIGYEAKRSKEEVRTSYVAYATRFQHEPFSDVYDVIVQEARLHYSDSFLLLQYATLLMNYAPQSDDASNVYETVAEWLEQVERIETDVWRLRQANALLAVLALFTGHPEKVIDRTAQAMQPNVGEEGLLIEAYEALGRTTEMRQLLHVSMYQHVLELLARLTKMLWHEQEKQDDTINRAETLIATWQLDRLHPNSVAQWYFMKAMDAARREAEQQVASALTQFVDVVTTHLFPVRLRGDAYFDTLDEWLEEALDLGAAPPRTEAAIWDSIETTLQHPAFTQWDKASWKRQLSERIQFARIGKERDE
ncbi:helix-turn-helix transcriptional regulator [Savagea sp. SN6]|uniref:Helix-turn-helix transcriptional regulator n=1 Tax=Savagea serpentis TaxID=2785297 RepID=A0A8J7KH13_9BACL|nr:helix-turn-helix transcriptional regulator [Savagea serpentis]MBF4500473.1 helix-turn-helix transcriptional regulator [Savagea serpentis]